MAVAVPNIITVTSLARCIAVLVLLGAVLPEGRSAAVAADPFEWLRPVITVDAALRSRIDRGEVIVRVLPSVDAEFGVFVASRLNADGEMLAAWAASIAQLKKGPFVLAVRRFSDPPVLEDLEGLALDETDLETVRRCKPGECDLKVAADDIASLRQTAETGGELWKDAVQREFRRAVLDRVNAYRTNGFAGLSPYADRRKPIDPKAAFGLLLGRSPYLQSDVLADASAIESFFYWSKEQYGIGKPVVTVVHVDVVRPRVPSALRVALISREILATHYRNASLGLTAVADDGAGQRYLIYLNRSQLDVLGGLFGGWKRAILEAKVKKESVDVFSAVRRRLESGPPLSD